MSDKLIGIAAVVATILLAIFGILLRQYVDVAQFVAICLACLLAILLLIWSARRVLRRVEKAEEVLKVAIAKAEKQVVATRVEVDTTQASLNSLSAELLQGSSERMSWATLWSHTCELQNRIASSDFKPEVVVSVGRSGATVGSILAGNLGSLLHLGIDRINTWSREKGASSRSVAIVPSVSSLTAFLKGRRILCVMSECDTGFTLEAATDALRAIQGVGEVRSAVLFRAANTHFVPDFIAHEDQGSRPKFPFKGNDWLKTSKAPP